MIESPLTSNWEDMELSYIKREKSFREIGKVLKLSFTTIRYIVKKYLETSSVENKARPGSPSKLTSRSERMIVSVSVFAQTVRNVLHSASLKARTPRKKPYISESKFEIFTPPNIQKIWRKNKTAVEPQNVLPTLKHGGGNVMVWGCVAHNGAGNLEFIDNKMNALAYTGLLRHHLLDSAKVLSMENTFIFQQGNDLKHTTIVTKTWLLYHAPRRLETPPQSPDLNPIKNLWMHLDTEVRKKCNK
ncbi:transposable element Tcb2 transposase [Trichonephila clavipes]|nr:transposable element Tcb2 transposase [Trichonephila clavipes]